MASAEDQLVFLTSPDLDATLGDVDLVAFAAPRHDAEAGAEIDDRETAGFDCESDGGGWHLEPAGALVHGDAAFGQNTEIAGCLDHETDSRTEFPLHDTAFEPQPRTGAEGVGGGAMVFAAMGEGKIAVRRDFEARERGRPALRHHQPEGGEGDEHDGRRGEQRSFHHAPALAGEQFLHGEKR